MNNQIRLGADNGNLGLPDLASQKYVAHFIMYSILWEASILVMNAAVTIGGMSPDGNTVLLDHKSLHWIQIDLSQTGWYDTGSRGFGFERPFSVSKRQRGRNEGRSAG